MSHDLYELILRKDYPYVSYYIYKLSNRKKSFIIYIVENGFHPRTIKIFTRRRRLVEKMIHALRNNEHDELINILYDFYRIRYSYF